MLRNLLKTIQKYFQNFRFENLNDIISTSRFKKILFWTEGGEWEDYPFIEICYLCTAIINLGTVAA